VRLRVATHVTTAIVERLPIPLMDDVADAPEIVRIGEILGKVRLKAEDTDKVRLKADATYVDRAYVVSGFSRTRVGSGFSRTRVGSGFSRTELFARLNALVAGFYQLTTQEFEHVLGTFPLVPSADRNAALREFQNRRV
jgi:hypothetical protein